MKLFGVNIPFRTIFVGYLLLPFVPLARALSGQQSFPEEGTFRQQADWVDSLPHACPYDHSSSLIQIRDSQNPFETLRSNPAYEGTIFEHNFFPDSGVATSRKLEVDQGSENVVSDETTVAIQGEGSVGPLIHTFKMDKHGRMIPQGKPTRGSIDKYGEGLVHEDAFEQEGIVIRTKKKGEERTCFTSAVRSKPKV
jgi:hypothetical protein